MLRELRKKDDTTEIRFWVDRKFAPQAKSILKTFDDTVRVDVISSGKFRRYHHVPMWRQLLWPSVVIPNIVDGFKIIAGAIQSIVKLALWRPDVVFTKGGFVCLPVGWAAHMLHIPLVIHDSDAHPGLTNRVLAKWADAIATGAPLEYYPYPQDRSQYVGIPIAADFKPVSSAQRKAEKELWGLDPNRPLTVVTGGGLGATRINNAVVDQRKDILSKSSVILVSGTAQYDELRKQIPQDGDGFQLHSFTTKMPSLLRAADVVVARAGATTILELAALEMPTILVPNARLTGGHQVKNAAVYAEKKAVVIVDEDEMIADPGILTSAIEDLLDNPAKAQDMGRRFGLFARPNAASDMAEMIGTAAQGKR